MDWVTVLDLSRREQRLVTPASGAGVDEIAGAEDQVGALIEVIDDGTGMPPDVEKRAFEPFFSTKGEGGMGLGLAMVYSTVMRHSGKISLVTELGKGTTFTLWFPAAG